ncbi:Sds3-like-domain-containing protein [Peziza echinospora]|nr:Sds3-like-domain-containing protein [Peziza echinospora]
MRSNKRGRRSRPSSHASEEQVELPLKRTRSTHSSPAAVPSTRSTPSYPARRQDTSRHSASATSRISHNHDMANHRDPSPIPELPLDEDPPPPMPSLESKVATLVESVKRRGSRDSKRPITPIPLPKVAELHDEGHISDLSSLSELEDSEAETERLDDSPRKGAPKSVFAYNQPSNRPTPLKISQDLKPNKSPELEPIPDEGESPTGKKRKRENGETLQTKEASIEPKTSQPATPLTAKAPTQPEKSKKIKPIEIPVEKDVPTTMEGIEPKSATPTVNGVESNTIEEQAEPEVPVVVEPAPPIEAEEVVKPAPPVEPEPEIDEEATENAEMMRRDEEDAEALTRKSAMDALTQIELEFAALRDKLFEERISDIDEEIRLVNEGKHPELMAMMEAVDKRRDDKIRLYNTQLKYSVQSQENSMKATRAQLHSQYAQHVREIRERYLDRVSEGLYQIQRERRASDMVVQDYTYRISDCSNTRLRERQAYTMEVAILAGIAKYIGFPAAPEVKGAAPNEMQADLEAMGVRFFH